MITARSKNAGRPGAWAKRAACLIAALLALSASALALPRELTDAAPEAAEEVLEELEELGELGSLDSFSGGVSRILRGLDLAAVLRQRLRGVASVLLAVALCGAAKGIGKAGPAVPMAGVLAVTALTAGSLESLIGLGWNTIRQLSAFSKVLLPTLAAAAAASGAVASAAFRQVTTVFLTEALMELMDTVLLPLTYLYIGVLTASCALPEDRLGLLAKGVRKAVSGILTVSLLAFTVYLSVFHVIAGTADGAAVKLTRTTISTVIPVVGGIVAEASEALLAGAGLLRSSIGVFGLLAILAACAWPFAQLGVQYLLYKGASLLASCLGTPELCRLLEGLGGAFALVLGMTGSCALLLFVSVLSFVSAVTP